jgi:hypothetical protein
VLRAQLFWFRDIVNYRGGLEWDLLKKAFLALGNVSVDDVSGLGEWGAVMLIVALRVFAPLALLAAAVALVRALLRRARPARRTWTLGPGQKRASALYRELRRTLEARGVATKGKTAGDLLQETAHYGPEVGMVREALTRYRLARFGARELPREDYRRLRAGLRRLRRQASVDSRSGLASGASGSG